jgi:hypothetical protein
VVSSSSSTSGERREQLEGRRQEAGAVAVPRPAAGVEEARELRAVVNVKTQAHWHLHKHTGTCTSTLALAQAHWHLHKHTGTCTSTLALAQAHWHLFGPKPLCLLFVCIRVVPNPSFPLPEAPGLGSAV